jgi:hypothetical protein
LTADGGPEEFAARYLAHLTIEAIRAVARKIEEHGAVGVTDEEGFSERRAARRTAEYATYKRFVRDRSLRNVIVNGLVLRRLEEDPAASGRLKDVLAWLHANYEATGVNQAEFVQRGLLQKAIDTLEATGTSEGKIGPQVKALLDGVEKYTRFVREEDVEGILADEIRIRVLNLTPNTFFVFGKGRAKIVAREGVRLAMKALPTGFIHHPEETKFDFVSMIGQSDQGKLRIRWSS